MASSRKSSRSNPPHSPLTKGGRNAGGLAARVAEQLKPVVKPGDRLTAGFSGGVDSIVLLDCLQRAARGLRIRLAALHVNHQLSPDAGRWSAFCRRVCRARNVPFRAVKVKVRRGNSTEAAARAARYAAFRGEPADYIVLAQHQDDQVETLLLQLLRGAGVKGLAAMPAVSGQRSAVSGQPEPRILRPMLGVTRAEIEAYARARKLKWVEDESNRDVYFQRNFLRHEVLPVLARRFPAYRGTVGRAARHLAEASQLLDEVAAADAAPYLENGTLAVEALRRLSAERARNLLRYFLAQRGASMPAAERLKEALRQVLTAKRDAHVLIDLGDASLGRFAGRLHVVRASRPPPANFARRWRGEREIALAELDGVLTLENVRGAGISVEKLRRGPVTIRARRGGERLQPDCRRPTRSLKNLLQEARMPPWLRERLPLIFHGDTLVWVPGIGVDCAFQAKRGGAALLPRWSPSA